MTLLRTCGKNSSHFKNKFGHSSNSAICNCKQKTACDTQLHSCETRNSKNRGCVPRKQQSTKVLTRVIQRCHTRFDQNGCAPSGATVHRMEDDAHAGEEQPCRSGRLPEASLRPLSKSAALRHLPRCGETHATSGHATFNMSNGLSRGGWT
jgi:hypothetical protein